MGWCHEFGSQIREGCDHPMEAGSSACGCSVCGVSCDGRFAGCASVWQRGPRKVTLRKRAEPVARRSRIGEPEVFEPAPASAVAPAASPPAANGHTVIQGDASGLRSEPGPVAAAEGSRAEILDWLRSAFDGVRADIRALADTVARQQSTLAGFEQAAVANDELLAATAVLPERVAAAVAAAVADASALTTPGAEDSHVDRVAGTLAGVEAVAAELRNELVRLAAFREALAADLPAVASAVDEASARAERRLRQLTDRVGELVGGVAPGAAEPARLGSPAASAGEHSPHR